MSTSPAAPCVGTYTALVTPFRDDRVDETAFARLLEDQIAAGIDGVIPVGTTGESATLSMEEHLRVIELTVQVVNHRVKVFAGTGSNTIGRAPDGSRIELPRLPPPKEEAPVAAPASSACS